MSLVSLVSLVLARPRVTSRPLLRKKETNVWP